MGYCRYDAHTGILIGLVSDEELKRWNNSGRPIHTKGRVHYHLSETSAGVVRLVFYKPIEKVLKAREPQYPIAYRHEEHGKYANPVALVTGDLSNMHRIVNPIPKIKL